MESKDPLVELLSSLEQIVFKEVPQPVRHSTKNSVFTEYELLRRGTGLKLDDFARARGKNPDTSDPIHSLSPQLTVTHEHCRAV